MKQYNLFCLPFAGGSMYSYRSFVTLGKTSNLAISAVELPGRGSRIKDALVSDIRLLADDVFRQLRGKLNQPYAIYGHSMGTLLAYLVVQRIVEHQLPMPVHLFLSGCGGPSVPEKNAPRHSLPREEFIAKLRELGGCPDEILEDDALLGFFEPILRSDFKAVENYRHVVATPLNVPMTVMIGTDEETTREEAQAWQLESTHEIDVIEFPGKHFFIYEHEAQMMNIFIERIKQPILQS